MENCAGFHVTRPCNIGVFVIGAGFFLGVFMWGRSGDIITDEPPVTFPWRLSGLSVKVTIARTHDSLIIESWTPPPLNPKPWISTAQAQHPKTSKLYTLSPKILNPKPLTRSYAPQPGCVSHWSKRACAGLEGPSQPLLYTLIYLRDPKVCIVWWELKVCNGRFGAKAAIDPFGYTNMTPSTAKTKA